MRIWYDLCRDLDKACDILAEGNEQAVQIIFEIIHNWHRIDPQLDVGPIRLIIQIDRAELYGDKLVDFYEKVCDKNPLKLVTVLRAIDLGILRPNEPLEALAGERVLNLETCNRMIREFLPKFEILKDQPALRVV